MTSSFPTDGHITGFNQNQDGLLNREVDRLNRKSISQKTYLCLVNKEIIAGLMLIYMYMVPNLVMDLEYFTCMESLTSVISFSCYHNILFRRGSPRPVFRVRATG